MSTFDSFEFISPNVLLYVMSSLIELINIVFSLKLNICSPIFQILLVRFDSIQGSIHVREICSLSFSISTNNYFMYHASLSLCNNAKTCFVLILSSFDISTNLGELYKVFSPFLLTTNLVKWFPVFQMYSRLSFLINMDLFFYEICRYIELPLFDWSINM